MPPPYNPHQPRGSLPGPPQGRPARHAGGWSGLRSSHSSLYPDHNDCYSNCYSNYYSNYFSNYFSTCWGWGWGSGRGSEVSSPVRLGLGHQRQKIFSMRPRNPGKGLRSLGQLPAFVLVLALSVLLAYLAFTTSVRRLTCQLAYSWHCLSHPPERTHSGRSPSVLLVYPCCAHSG